MSKSNGKTKVTTFKGWGFIQPSGWIECADCAPSANMDVACTSAGNVGWTNLFTSPCVGDKVILRKNVGASGRCGEWVMTGLAC